MQHAIDILHQEANAIKKQVGAGAEREENLRRMAEIQQAIGWLTRLQELDVTRVRDYNLIQLPKRPDGGAEYRVMRDYDSEERADWEETEGDISMSGGDIIICRKV